MHQVIMMFRGKFALLVVITVITAQMFGCFLLRWANLRLNRKKREAAKDRHGWTDEPERQKHAFLDLTDRQYGQHPFSVTPKPVYTA